MVIILFCRPLVTYILSGLSDLMYKSHILLKTDLRPETFHDDVWGNQ